MLSGLVRRLVRAFDSRESERVQLNRDARVVIEQAERAYGVQNCRAIARHTAGELEAALPVARADPALRRHQLERVRELHRAARRSNSQVELTAHTLTIIYLRSLTHGEGTLDARSRIEAFVARWRHADPDQQLTLEG